MKLIVQKDEYGCAVASMANVLEISYDDTLKLIDNGKFRAKTQGFYCKEIVGALNSAGLNYRYKHIKPRLRRKIYRDGVIVFIERSKRFPAGHFLTRKNGIWYDSWINFPDDNKRAGVRKRLPGRPIYMIFPI